MYGLFCFVFLNILAVVSAHHILGVLTLSASGREILIWLYGHASLRDICHHNFIRSVLVTARILTYIINSNYKITIYYVCYVRIFFVLRV